MVDAGHFKELDNILQLLQQRSYGGGGVEGEEEEPSLGRVWGEEEEADAAGAGADTVGA